ncbi:MAG: VOC family protein [Rhodothermales bacterium]
MSNLEFVRSYFQQFFSGKADHSAVREWITDDFTFRDPLMSADGADDYVNQLKALGTELEMYAEIREIIEQGRYVSALVTVSGPFGSVSYAQWFTLRGQKIARLETFYDPRPFFNAPPPDEGSGHPANPPAGYSRITPYINYEDTGAMMEWLARAFGMVERHAVRDAAGAVSHAEMTLDGAVVMMGTPQGEFLNPRHVGHVTQSLYVYIDNLDQHCERARAADAEILEEPADQPYGDRRYGARDPEGHTWYFASRSASVKATS